MFPRISEAATVHAKNISAGGPLQRGPIAGVVDPRTGNAIFAMGLEGALVRKSSGEYVWVAVGNFGPLSNDPMQVLGGEQLLAINFGLLVLAMLATRAIRHWIKYVLIVFAGLLSIASVVICLALPPVGEGGGLRLFSIFGSCAIVGIIALILTFIAARRSRGFAARIFAVALVGAPIFFAPYYLWALDRIPTYTAAMLFALALGALVLLAGFFVSRGFAPPIKLESGQQD